MVKPNLPHSSSIIFNVLFLFVYALFFFFLPSSSCYFLYIFIYIHFNITFHSTYVLSMTLVLLFCAIYKTYKYIFTFFSFCHFTVFMCNIHNKQNSVFYLLNDEYVKPRQFKYKKKIKLHHIQSIKHKKTTATEYVVCNLRICFVFGVFFSFLDYFFI